MADIIVAGNTSGSITISAPLVAGSGTLTLPTGTDTLIGKATTDTLTNKSIAATQLTGTIAAARLPAGSVLQVVQGTYSTTTTNNTNVYADTGLTATITPRSTSNYILVLISHPSCVKTSNNLNNAINLQLLRGASVLTVFNTSLGYTASATPLYISASYNYLDSPATTSATTYKTQFCCDFNGPQVQVQASASKSTITLMEIQG